MGFRNRREIAQNALRLLNLPPNCMRHGIGRELFVVPLAENTREFLRGTDDALRPFDSAGADIAGHFRERWMLPRAVRDRRWRDFDRREYLLWKDAK